MTELADHCTIHLQIASFGLRVRPILLSTISFNEQDGQTEVMWENKVDWGSRPLSRLIGFLMGKQILLESLKFGLKSLEQRANQQSSG